MPARVRSTIRSSVPGSTWRRDFSSLAIQVESEPVLLACQVESCAGPHRYDGRRSAWPSRRSAGNKHMMTDLTVACRGLRRSPAFTVAAIVTLALGIGANTAMFSVVNAVLLRPLPGYETDRLTQICDHTRGD